MEFNMKELYAAYYRLLVFLGMDGDIVRRHTSYRAEDQLGIPLAGMITRVGGNQDSYQFNWHGSRFTVHS